ncbi:long-chain-acyl-CoA synthetase [Faunimonas sp. B44]|uniref:long-chain-acyl-CoA synthetase n=1 Tax=Faunimonas sp. B44 TaxID=3461493 RepID=UPI004043E0BF
MGFVERVGSEIAYLRGALRTLSKVTPIAKDTNRTYPDVAEALAAEHGDKAALVSDRESFSYRAYNARANRYARWAAANGVAKGDTVALLMPNRPEYLAIWLGIARAGGVTALLNTNLTGPALGHCINIVHAKHIIVEASLVDAFKTAETHLDPGPKLWCHGGAPAGWERIDTVIDRFPDAPIPAGERPKLTNNDRCLYIYTSGTTGLPKAANINHYRVQGIMYAFNAAMAMSQHDRIYVCLPLYHTSGGVLASGAALTAGGTVIIREKFSATQFWDDIVDNECTVFQYIGELCRYLLNSPTHPKETRHRLRLASGNGLRPDIWQDFQTRFRIPKILEWYGATEGNAVLFNFDGKVGSVGRIPKWAERRFLTEVVRFDLETEQPVRGADGFCIKCAPGEVGEMISQIVNDPLRPSQRFEGYADSGATQKKIMTDVFARGDRWFRTGDLMRKDAHGYFYFIDRIGDTFRWKGENVSTSEVSEAITIFPGVKEANVYGVKIPNTEGRAGMVALVIDEGWDPEGFYTHVSRQLPAYARPVIVRIQREIDATSTFKQRKVDLVKEGFDPALIADALYFLHPGRQAYVPLTADLYGDIVSGRLKL